MAATSTTTPADAKPLRTLYPYGEARRSGRLDVGDGHNLYWEEHGPADAKQVAIVVHGGPGGGLSQWVAGFFDPARYRVVLYDQRGAGQSTPHAELKANTTPLLVADLEKLRESLGIERFVLFGGSWGSTLALAYAEAHPTRVKALVLRGIFTLRREELLFFYQEGASWLFPDHWEHFVAPIPEVERGDLMSAYYRRLTGDDADERLRCARAWTRWEMATSALRVSDDAIARGEEEKFALAFSRIECHYFVNGGFFSEDSQLIKRINIVRDAKIPGVIVQGRYDVVCPMKTAWDLHRAWPESELKVIPDAGHSMKEAGITSELVIACDKFADAQ